MCEILFSKDGRREIIGRDEHFTDLLRSTLGDDAAQWFEDRISDLTKQIETLQASECRREIEEYMHTYFIPNFACDVRFAGDLGTIEERKNHWESEFKSAMEDIYGE